MWNLKIYKFILRFWEKSKEKITKIICHNKYIIAMTKMISRKYFDDDRYVEEFKPRIIKIVRIVCTGAIVLLTMTIAYTINSTKELEYKEVEKIEELAFEAENKELELIAKISNENYEIEERYKVNFPKKDPTPEQIVDRLLNLINHKSILGNNLSLDEVTEKLNLETKNVYGANIRWESLKGYVNIETGEVLRKPKGEGNEQDVLKVIIEYSGIIKVREFKINILEMDDSIEKLVLEMDKTALDNAVKENKIFVNKEDTALELINNIGTSKIKWYQQTVKNSNSKEKYSILIFVSLCVMVLCCIRELKIVLENAQKRVVELESELPNFISKYMLLSKAGYNMINAIEYICLKEKDTIFYNELRKMLRKIELGKYMYQALDEFGNESGSEIIKKFINNLISNMKRGNRSINEFFREELKIAHNNRKEIFRKKAEENSVKVVVAFILILFATMLIVVYPAIISLDL